MMKVSVYSAKNFEREFLEEANRRKHELIWVEDPLQPDTADKVDGSEAVITFPSDDVSAPVLDKLNAKGVKYLLSRSAGTDHIDIDHAKSLGMKVAHAPQYSPYAVAEHAVGMMLALNRKYMEAVQKIQQHDFRLDGLIGFDMHGKTVGIIGAGSIGAVVARILHGFGCRLLIWDKVENNDLVEKYGARYVALDELCKESHIITIHAPLTDETRHLINKKRIEQMRDGVMIINTGRGAIIHTHDLIEGLKSGKIGSVGLDVYEKEDELFFKDHSSEPLKDEAFAYLQANRNVLITGHQAFATDTAIRNMSESVFESLEQWEKGQEPENAL
jgi:D-lactate dehydrogenase